MFYDCDSLTNINLSNFNIQNVSEMDGMFEGCNLLNKQNLIRNDKKIMELLDKHY